MKISNKLSKLKFFFPLLEIILHAVNSELNRKEKLEFSYWASVQRARMLWKRAHIKKNNTNWV